MPTGLSALQWGDGLARQAFKSVPTGFALSATGGERPQARNASRRELVNSCAEWPQDARRSRRVQDGDERVVSGKLHQMSRSEMIELFIAEPSVHTYFEQRGSQLQFQWVVFLGPDQRLKSDWLSLLEARDLDGHLIREFKARFNAWEEIRDQIGSNEILAYFEMAKHTGSLEFEPPPRWSHLHHVYRTYTACKDAVTDILLDRASVSRVLHPSSITVRWQRLLRLL